MVKHVTLICYGKVFEVPKCIEEDVRLKGLSSNDSTAYAWAWAGLQLGEVTEKLGKVRKLNRVKNEGSVKVTRTKSSAHVSDTADRAK